MPDITGDVEPDVEVVLDVANEVEVEVGLDIGDDVEVEVVFDVADDVEAVVETELEAVELK